MTSSVNKLSGLDEFFLQLEKRRRPTHWSMLFEFEDVNDDLNPESFTARVLERARTYPLFRLGVRGGWGVGGPSLYSYDDESVRSCVESRSVRDENEWSLLMEEMLTVPLPRDRPSWHVSLVEQASPRRQRILLRVHHSMCDGVSGSAYAGLVVDETGREFKQLDRYLTADRFDPRGKTGPFGRAAVGLVKAWQQGASFRGRLPRMAGSPRVLDAYIDIGAAELRSRAAEYSAGTVEYLAAVIGHSVAESLRDGGQVKFPRTLRAVMPITLDNEWRHAGNAISIVVINLGGESDDMAKRITEAKQQIDQIAAAGSQYALPVLAKMASIMPWPVRRTLGRITMASLRPDIHFGVNPVLVTFNSVLGSRISGFGPYSPLVGNIMSFTCMMVGSRLSIGFVWDAAVLGDEVGERIVERVRAGVQSETVQQ